MKFILTKTVEFRRAGTRLDYKVSINAYGDSFTIVGVVNDKLFYNQVLTLDKLAETLNALTEDGYRISEITY